MRIDSLKKGISYKINTVQLINKPMKNLKIINLTLAFLWIYQGLVPKVLFINPDEILIWEWIGLSHEYAELAGQASGVGEIIFGLLFLLSSSKYVHYLNIFNLVVLFALVSFVLPDTLIRAFNPVVMNVSMISLSILYLHNIKQEDSQPHLIATRLN